MASHNTSTRASAKIDWRDAPEMPQKHEILARDPPHLPHNDVTAPPRNKSRYVEVQYQLLRYEGTELLRRAVQEFRDNPKMMESSNTAIYTNVSVHGYLVTRIGTLCRIGFCPSRVDRRIRWAHSPRLTPGSIVALSTVQDGFQSICMIAHVVQKTLVGGLEPDLGAGEHKDSPPRIDIAWAEPNDAILDPNTEMIMIEARNGYYESVRHTMRGLQEWSGYSSLFERYLIDGSKTCRSPKFMEDLDHMVDLKSIVVDNVAMGDGDNPANSPHIVNMKGGLSSFKAVSTGLDSSQMSALHHVLTSEIAVVQGPPGTGKTFTSISALKVLLTNLDSQNRPIIIAAQTNHALDQILLLLSQTTKTEFVRLGRRTQNEFITSRTVFNLRQKSQKNPGSVEYGRIESRRKAHIGGMKDLISECFPDGFLKPRDLLAYGIITQAQHDSLEMEDPDDPFFSWLDGFVEPCAPHRFAPTTNQWEEIPDPEFHEDRSVSVDDDGRDRLSGQYIQIMERWTGRVDPHMLKPALWRRTQSQLNRYQDLWDMPREYRGGVYRYLRNCYIEARTKDLRTLLEENVQLTKDARACRAISDARVIQEFGVPVVGCTTTGLTKYRKLIELLKPRVMLIEEAAETREANITSALFPSLEQLILVGDHMQLAPHTDLSELADHPYNLCVSLFERMINLKMTHAVLTVQRRMVPEIRRILKPFYPKLQDHKSVINKLVRPPVPGMGDTSSYFFCHKLPESRTYQQSRVNEDEAKMIVGFMRYLVQNGTSPSKITVLTFYRGQRNVIRDKLRRDVVLNNLNLLREYNVHTVDGYQGEENDIVILSLVRSPGSESPYNVGFLDNRNRVVVALSRARRGFYIFGNYRNLVQASQRSKSVWKPSVNVFIDQNRCHSKLPLTCKKHGEVVEVKDPEDWECLHGGCRQKCKTKLECGHECQLLCHPFSHSRVACKQPCNRKLPCGHGCSELCSDRCRCGQKCDYIAEVAKKAGANFITLDKFLGSEEEMSDEALTASSMGEDTADLISSWGDEVGHGAVKCRPNASQIGLGYLDSSETDGERNGHSSGSCKVRHSSQEGSPATVDCSSGYPTESPSLSGSVSEDTGRMARSWSTWDPEVYDYNAERETNGKMHRKDGTVFKGTWREIRVRDGCKREWVGVHRSTDVHDPPEVMKSDCGRSTPRTAGGPIVIAPEVPGGALIDASEAPVYSVVSPASSYEHVSNELAGRNGDASKYEALGLWERVAARADATIVTTGSDMLIRAEVSAQDADTRSEVSDLIKF